MRFLHIDLVLAALIAPAGDPMERLMAEAEASGDPLGILELALYYAVCSVEEGDQVDFARFTRLLRCSQIIPSPKPFDPPSREEIAHWRDVALGRESVDSE